MPEESKKSKAIKLAAARKKLKEYQQRGTGSVSGSNATSASYCYPDSTNSGHVSSNISERSESDLQLNGSVNELNPIAYGQEQGQANEVKEHLPAENVNYFAEEPDQERIKDSKIDMSALGTAEDFYDESSQNINALQVLITEKSQLTTELNKFRILCREKDLEIEELRVQHSNASNRVEELSQRLVDIQKQQDQQKLHNAELQHKLAQARAQQEDHSSHINELQQQLSLRDERFKQLESDIKEKSNELELSQLRIRQLSDENSITKDNRVETLTKTLFMYEQQISDLQAMVLQLTKDKEQANAQYQSYVQQLNAQSQQLTERNNELVEESEKLREREKQCVDHIQQLEKEIQKNISRQTEVKQDILAESHNEDVESLKDRINEFESVRYEFQLKIKSQEDRLNFLTNEMQQKDVEIEKLKEHLENVTCEQPDKTKLLATMESDKVAASRALTQNFELKKQLDELEMRFVQLTNDKADLVNRLDSEQYANREMHANYAATVERLKTIDECFKFKDEEMIRLSHENEELKKEIENKKVFRNEENDSNNKNHQNHDCGSDYHPQSEHNNEHEHKHDHPYDCDHHTDGHDRIEHPIHDHCHDDNHCNDHKDEHNHHHYFQSHEAYDQEACEEATENIPNNTQLQRPEINKILPNTIAMPHIATEDAVEKLQQRFTQLITQCAELTEEKQRLEHLVMQLQSETETIGEYITLYQTQRRILKQREYEKAAQTALLHAEREQMQDRLTLLNNLVHSLGMELPQNQQRKPELNKVLAQNSNQQSETTEDSPSPPLSNTKTSESSEYLFSSHQMATKDLNVPESQQILHKIQDIITEIKENTKDFSPINTSVDQLNCCLGKFEVV